MSKMLMVLLVGVALCPAPGFAGQEVASRVLTARATHEFRNAVAGIDRGAEVTLTLRDKSVVTGRLDHVGDRALYVVNPNTGAITQVAVRALDKLEWWPDPSLRTRIIVLSGVAAVTILAGLAAR
jgi:hypothetical protein